MVKVDLHKISLTIIPTPYIYHCIAKLDIDGYKHKLEMPMHSYLHPMVQFAQKGNQRSVPEITYNLMRPRAGSISPQSVALRLAVKRPCEPLEDINSKAAKLGKIKTYIWV